MGKDLEKTNNQEALSFDVKDLQSLSFGPKWGKSTSTDTHKLERENKPRNHFNQERPRNSKPLGNKDRRSFQKPSPVEYKPTRPLFYYTIHFYPEDAPFQALTKALKQSCKTYELFEIAQLILEKPERFVAIIKGSPSKDCPEPKFFCTVQDQIPFLSEDEALQHILKNHIQHFFTLETIEVEAPKGQFPFIQKCGFTGDYITPPNYHKAQQLLQEHHASKLSNMSYERFVSKLENDKSPEAQAAWLEKMKQATRYIPLSREDSDPEYFETLEAAKNHIVLRHKEKAIRIVESARISGKLIDTLPNPSLKKALLEELDHQRHFPLNTANNLRSRLRRLNFNIYKKGTKGVSLICAIKRKFRDENTQFSDTIQSVIGFIDQHPLVPINTLPEKMLGITTASDSEETKANPTFKQLMIDLRWLISEGYVTEFGNGTLVASQIIPSSKKKSEVTIEDDSIDDEPDAVTTDLPDASSDQAIADITEKPLNT